MSLFCSQPSAQSLGLAQTSGPNLIAFCPKPLFVATALIQTPSLSRAQNIPVSVTSISVQNVPYEYDAPTPTVPQTMTPSLTGVHLPPPKVSHDWTQTYGEGEDVLKVLILLPPTAEGWDFSHTVLCIAVHTTSRSTKDEPRHHSCMLGEHSSSWATSQPLHQFFLRASFTVSDHFFLLI